MILRDWLETLQRTEATGPAPRFRNAARTMRHTLEGAMRFVFRPAAAEACEQIAARPEALDAAREQLFAPWPNTWLEWEGSPNAVLWMADDERGRVGNCICVGRSGPPEHPLVMLPFQVDLGSPEYIRIPPMAHAIQALPGAQGVGLDLAKMERNGTPLTLGRAMLSAWALLATKGMTHSVQTDLSKLNAARGKRGLYPLLGYQHIRLNLDAERAVRERQGGTAVATGNMPLHPVRAHLRLLPSGRVVIVTAHMRGNPERGVRHNHYTVGRDEDMHS